MTQSDQAREQPLSRGRARSQDRAILWRDLAYAAFSFCGTIALIEGLSVFFGSFISSFTESGLLVGLLMLVAWGCATLLASMMALVGMLAFWREPPLLFLSALALLYVPLVSLGELFALAGASPHLVPTIRWVFVISACGLPLRWFLLVRPRFRSREAAP